MRWRLTFIALLFLSSAAAADPGLYQVSTIDALLSGVYDGETTFGELRQHGDFGIGTFNRLDGEMLAVDGAFYQIRADGKVYTVHDDQRTPFSAVVFFKPKQEKTLAPGLDFAGLEKWLDGQLTNLNQFYAVRIEGTFATVKTRSVPAQTKPYPPLAEAAKKQSVFDLRNVRGVIVGFRSPAFVKGINVPGYHLHFISADRQTGGHVLNFTLDRAIVKWQPIRDLQVRLPQDDAFAAANLSQDRQKELSAVEK